VVDQVGVLNGDTRSRLEQELWALKKEKGSEVAVLIVASTKPEEIEQYSIRVVDAWKLGRKGIDDGVLLLVALNDRRVRIEVGRGLEGDIPDVKAFRIIDELIVPRFKEGDISGGVVAGVNALAGLIRGVDLPPAKSQRGGSFDSYWSVIVFGFVVGMILSSFTGLILGGGIGGLVAFLMGYFLFAPLVALVMGLVVLVLVPVLGGLEVPTGGRGGSRYGGGWGGSSSGGSFGGGSFGGGGSFSGGGSSGRW
jgi:uncharacterized protein